MPFEEQKRELVAMSIVLHATRKYLAMMRIAFFPENVVLLAASLLATARFRVVGVAVECRSLFLLVFIVVDSLYRGVMNKTDHAF